MTGWSLTPTVSRVLAHDTVFGMLRIMQKQPQCPACLAVGAHVFPCEEGAPVTIEQVRGMTRGGAAKALDDARIMKGITVSALADRTAVPYERMRDTLRGQGGGLDMDELDRVLRILGLGVMPVEAR